MNPNAIHLLEKNQNKIDLIELLNSNPSIIDYDYKKMKQITSSFNEELIQKVFHPSRVEYYLLNYNYNIGIEEYWN
jgi:hypothetical protein